MKDYKIKLPSHKFFRIGFGSKPIFSREGTISNSIIGQKYIVYNGNSFRSFIPKVEIVSSAVGHFVFTKITGSSIHRRKRKKKEKKKRGKK